MLTPVFSINQDDTHLIVSIRAPYAKIAETEIEYGDDIFVFSSKPYYLRLHLTGKVIDDETGSAKYDADQGSFVVRVPKLTKGEVFDRLDMISELLRPQRKELSARRLVEEINEGEGSESEEEEEEWEEEDGDEFLIEQREARAVREPVCDEAARQCGYGFAWRRTGVLAELADEIGKLVEMDEPEGSLISERPALALQADEHAFCADHYLADTLAADDELTRVIGERERLQLKLTDADRERLKDMPDKKLPTLSLAEHRQVAASLVDMVYAWAYDQRTTDWEGSVESGWTIAKLSPSLAFLCRWDSVKDALAAAARRSLVRPIYRNWQLAMAVLEDTKKIVGEGRTALLHCMCDMHAVMVSSGEFRYLLNDLYLTDYVLWVQAVDEEVIEWMKQQVDKVELTKADTGLELDDLEMEARLQMLSVGGEEGLDSDDEP